MNYNNEELLRDFIQRTKQNLIVIEEADFKDPKSIVYPTTQLINSLLGLLVFPFEHMGDQIPYKDLQDLEKEGWVIPKVIGRFEQVKDLRQFIAYLRNSVSHFNIDFNPDANNEIKSIIVCNKKWNKVTSKYDIPNWKAEITILGLRDNVLRFIDLLLSPDKTN